MIHHSNSSVPPKKSINQVMHDIYCLPDDLDWIPLIILHCNLQRDIYIFLSTSQESRPNRMVHHHLYLLREIHDVSSIFKHDPGHHWRDLELHFGCLEACIVPL